MVPMDRRTCLRCDWEGDATGDTCPRCGQRPLYVVPPAGRTRSEPAPPRVGPYVPETAPAQGEPAGWELTSSEPLPFEPPRWRSSVAFVALAAVAAVLVVSALHRPANQAAVHGPSAPRFIPPRPAQPGSMPVRGYAARRRTLAVDGVRFSFEVPTQGWQSFGSISVSMSARGSHDGSAIVFWTGVPGASTRPCAIQPSSPGTITVTDLADAMGNTRGLSIVSPPARTTVGGRPATRVSVQVRRDAGCDPGYFFSWKDTGEGSLWPGTTVGDLIQVWVVDTGGDTPFVVEAETTRNAGPELRREVGQIVGSMRFAK